MKRITTAMVEAGVTALANARKLSDQSVVAAVFTAMEACRRGEESRTRNDPAPLYVHQAWPAWKFGPNGESAVFNSADKVPEGWGDAPAAAIAKKLVRRTGAGA